jgi:hypothetical protein
MGGFLSHIIWIAFACAPPTWGVSDFYFFMILKRIAIAIVGKVSFFALRNKGCRTILFKQIHPICEYACIKSIYLTVVKKYIRYLHITSLSPQGPFSALQHMFLLRRHFAVSLMVGILCTASLSYAQTGRIFGARGFQLDDGTGSGKSLIFDLASGLTLSYRLHFPSAPPVNTLNFLASDASGNLSWVFNTLPPLAPGNLWYGNALSVATPLAPTAAGAILSLNNSLFPVWTNTLPLSTTVSASQITSGTLPAGTVIDVGPGATVEPAGGTINANLLSGSGAGKFSGKIVITNGANHLDISYPLIAALSSVTVSVFDPQAMIFGFVEAQVSQITPGTGFRVIFSADYPNSGTGELHYTVVNP